LGQNFLIDLNLMRLLVDNANIGNDDIVLEVGCGTGSLTQALAERAGKVIAVELDETLAKIAARELAKAGNVEVINADILESKNTINRTVSDAIEQARKNRSGRFLLVSNLPYSVASPLMMNLITSSIVTDAMHVTVQKEVADRMTAGPGDKHYGTLSIHMAATGDVKTERVLKPTVFWPQPQVDSAMISFVRRKDKISRIYNMELFSKVIGLFMQHRRKMLKGCVKFVAGKLAEIDNWSEIFERCRIDPHNRPEQLRPEDFISISNLCYKYLTSKS
ncbi:MAG: 16S rRNA (adenine(1518)-N(6)/adenine(1519)-N(6))-dimethyltransferase RsmA, partial [Sedimentisphaerales bacterium]|nr:16S rRNA (adenine(1518)-N(6)/adenine(1519)-N(6))-dimethyltransferase RsmA [Sedimentisphaerales bacterium]